MLGISVLGTRRALGCRQGLSQPAFTVIPQGPGPGVPKQQDSPVQETGSQGCCRDASQTPHLETAQAWTGDAHALPLASGAGPPSSGAPREFGLWQF